MKRIEQTTSKNDPPRLVHHLDLSAGYHTIHRIDTFPRQIVDIYRQLLPAGGRVPHVTGAFRFEIEGPFFTLLNRETPILLGGVGCGPDRTWRRLESALKEMDWTLEVEPRQDYWLGEIPLEALYKLKGRQVYWIFDCLRFLGAAMLTSESNRPV